MPKDLMTKYRGTVVAVCSTQRSSLKQALTTALEEMKLSDTLMKMFPKGCAVVAALPNGKIVEGNVCRYEGIKNNICIDDHEYGEEWVPVSSVERI